MSFAKLCLVFALVLACQLPLISKPTRTLQEAAQRIIRHYEKGCVVTAEMSRSLGDVAYAYAGEKPDIPLPPEKWIFEIGSITKVFNSLLLAIAIQESRVQLDSSLAQLLEPTYKFKHSTTGRITLRQLATHRSGLPRLPSNLPLKWDPRDPYAHYTEEDLLREILSFERPSGDVFPYSYSNFGHGILGMTLSQIYGKSWEELIEEKICKPLGLDDTFVFRANKTVMLGYSGKNWVPGWRFQSMVSAGGLHSTAQDLCKFGEAILHPENTPIEDAFKVFLQIQTSDSPKMGLGWFSDEFFGEHTLEHGGTTGGFQSHLQVIPEIKTVRVILTNQVALAPERVLNALIQRPAPPLSSLRKLTPEQLSDYVGHYQVSPADNFDVILHKKQLWMKRTGERFHPLFVHDIPDRFFLKNEPVQIQFSRHNEKLVEFTFERLGRRVIAKKSSNSIPFAILSESDLTKFCGEYLLMGLTPLKVFQQGNLLHIQLEGEDALKLYAVSSEPRTFISDQIAVRIQFLEDNSKIITSLILHQNGSSLPCIKKSARVTSSNNN